ncbi:MAG: radical SAM protein [Dehalococcoidia bacterium]|nr:radical SAM protein [Dehalococcoidia bacterium]
MISVSRLLCGVSSSGDALRYRPVECPASQEPRPIVVWNCTRRCNLHCMHCYASAGPDITRPELSSEEAKGFINDLRAFDVPVLLFSGGEPLLREDIFDLAAFARGLGVRAVLSTNGTLIDDKLADRIAQTGFSEVGISLDGSSTDNDRFRGVAGAYKAALAAVRRCKARGQKLSLRFTITPYNLTSIPAIFDLIEQENIERVCFYHLAFVGRAGKMHERRLSHAETRATIDLICDRTLDLYRRGIFKEVLTVDNHADGIYIYQKVLREQPRRAAEVLELLRMNGGNNSGIRISAVDDIGDVHADQFWWHYSFGNVRERKFGDIWLDTRDPLMRGLKTRKGLLRGRCSRCGYIDLCNGNLRVRAEAVFGDVWAEDPACYLTDEEIRIKEPVKGV